MPRIVPTRLTERRAVWRAKAAALGRPVGFSHTAHMQEMFALYLRSGSGRALWMGSVGREQLYAAYCAGYTEGAWTERVHPAGMRKEAGDGDD